MKVFQGATILNNVINKMQIGEVPVLAEDMSNIVDVGKVVIDYTSADKANFDSFVRELIDQVGKVQMVDRVYRSQAPNIFKDGWEYGSILQKVRCELKDARPNATWQLKDYADASTYPDPFELSPPDVQAVFFNGKTTYEVPITLAEYQLKEAFRGASEMMRFYAMIENRIAMKKTLCNDGLIMGTINNLMAQKIAYGENVVDLLSLWNTFSGGSDSKAQAFAKEAFWRFVSMTIGKYKKYIAGASNLYNHGTYVTFTPADRLKFIMVTDYARALDTYLYSDTYHEDYVKLDGFEEVGYWCGSGTADGDRDKLSVETTIQVLGSDVTKTVAAEVVAVMFDTEAAAVCNENDRVTSIWNPRGEYLNSFYKWDACYLNDIQENCVVFTIGTPSTYTVKIPVIDKTVNTTNYPSWNSTYAVTSSTYYLYNPEDGTYNQFKASDKTTADGFNSDDYQGLMVVQIDS